MKIGIEKILEVMTEKGIVIKNCDTLKFNTHPEKLENKEDIYSWSIPRDPNERPMSSGAVGTFTIQRRFVDEFQNTVKPTYGTTISGVRFYLNDSHYHEGDICLIQRHEIPDDMIDHFIEDTNSDIETVYFKCVSDLKFFKIC